MKSYAEHNNNTIVDWGKELKSLILAKGNNLNDPEKYEKVLSLAKDWETCPLGQSNIKIPRGTDGEPNDKVLRVLGQQFYSSLSLQNYEDCKSILELIEQRVPFIVKEEDKRIAKKTEDIERKIKEAVQKIKEIKNSLSTLEHYEEVEGLLDNFNEISF